MSLKLTASLNLKAQGNQYLFGIEAEVGEQSQAAMATQIHKAITALEIAVNDAMGMRHLSNDQASKPKQLPTDSATPAQLKYLNDLASQAGITLEGWCDDHGVPKANITAQDCQEWIPELQQMVQANHHKSKNKKQGNGFFD